MSSQTNRTSTQTERSSTSTQSTQPEPTEAEKKAAKEKQAKDTQQMIAALPESTKAAIMSSAEAAKKKRGK